MRSKTSTRKAAGISFLVCQISNTGAPFFCLYRPDATAHILNGIQKVSKFNEHGQGGLNTVAITLVCLRIPSASTDLLLSHNRSVDIGPQSSSAGLASAGGASEAGSIDDKFLRGI